MVSDVKHLLKRESTYYFKMRCPKRFRGVCESDFIIKTLRTDSLTAASEMVPLVKKQVLAELEARLSGQAPEGAREAYDATVALVKSHGFRPLREDQVETAPIAELLARIERVQHLDPAGKSKLAEATLSVQELPHTKISELPTNMERLLPHEVSMKNDRQRTTWAKKFSRAVNSFIEAVGDKRVTDITEQDAHDLRRHWHNRVHGPKPVVTEYANKHFGYLRTIIDCFYADLKIDRYVNPFEGISIKQKPLAERKRKDTRKLELPPKWIKDTLLTLGPLDRMNDEARDILIVCAETGCRHAEIFDVPDTSIFLDAPIPYIAIQVEDSLPGQKRDIKTAASIRDVPLVGHALEAMKRHPKGFPRYRGNSNFYATAQKFFRDKNLLPTERHSIGGLRHSYESRMRRAGIDNEERAFMMGHSMRKVRGREFYGDETNLTLRALYAEMIAFPTEKWTPRSHEEIRAEIEKLLTDEGFRVS